MTLLIVGLGNPDKEYKNTRHNVGEDFIDLIADRYKIELKKEMNLLGTSGKGITYSSNIHLLKTDHYMNENGICVSNAMRYLNLSIDQILIVHDELDVPTGHLRCKEMGGHGRHNGLRSIITQPEGASSFKR